MAQFRTAKSKFEVYQDTVKKIPGQGVKLGDIIDIENTKSENVMHLLNNLEKLAQPRAFCCGGWVELRKKDLKTHLKIKADKLNQSGWPITELPVEDLLKFCTPAQYGDLNKQETVYDPNVRLASECLASQFDFVKKPHVSKKASKRGHFPSSQNRMYCPMFLDHIREKVSSDLANGTDVDLECHKLNVYGKDGFFKPHVDTPVDPARMIGTVVVCLPCWHTGGTLSVEHQGIEEEFVFASMSEDRKKIQWAAFYSDCIHEILPVQEGHRITITFNIIRRRPYDAGYPSCKKEAFFRGPVIAANKNITLDNIILDVIKIASDRAVTTDGDLEHFGIFLQHRYTAPALAAGNFKGFDQVLFDGLTSRGLTCQAMTVLVHELEKKTDDEGCKFCEEDEMRKVYAFSQEDVAYVNKRAPKPKHAYWKKMQFIREWSKEQLIVERRETEARTLGNEFDPGEIERLYLQSALIIDIPQR